MFLSNNIITASPPALRTLWDRCSTCLVDGGSEWTCPAVIATYNELLGDPTGTEANVVEVSGEDGEILLGQSHVCFPRLGGSNEASDTLRGRLALEKATNRDISRLAPSSNALVDSSPSALAASSCAIRLSMYSATDTLLLKLSLFLVARHEQSRANGRTTPDILEVDTAQIRRRYMPFASQHCL